MKYVYFHVFFYRSETHKIPLPYQANQSRHSKGQKRRSGEFEIALIGFWAYWKQLWKIPMPAKS